VTSRSPFVVVANRLPVDEEITAEGRAWRVSPGGLVTALRPVVAGHKGAWVGWGGNVGPAVEPFELDGIRLHPSPSPTGSILRLAR
jgi:trehalose 6-phosphate synthase